MSFEDRLKRKEKDVEGDKSMNPVLEVLCRSSHNNNATVALNDKSNLVFDNQYFKDLLARRGVLTVDANIASDERTLPTVRRFAASQQAFFHAYTTAFLKLTQAAVLSDAQGQVRKRCSLLN